MEATELLSCINPMTRTKGECRIVRSWIVCRYSRIGSSPCNLWPLYSIFLGSLRGSISPIPTDTSTVDPLRMLQHRFGPVCFPAVSLLRTSVALPVRSLPRDFTTGFGWPPYRCPPLSGCRGRYPPVSGMDIKYTLEDMIRRMFVSTWPLGSTWLRVVVGG